MALLNPQSDKVGVIRLYTSMCAYRTLGALLHIWKRLYADLKSSKSPQVVSVVGDGFF